MRSININSVKVSKLIKKIFVIFPYYWTTNLGDTLHFGGCTPYRTLIFRTNGFCHSNIPRIYRIFFSSSPDDGRERVQGNPCFGVACDERNSRHCGPNETSGRVFRSSGDARCLVTVAVITSTDVATLPLSLSLSLWINRRTVNQITSQFPDLPGSSDPAIWYKCVCECRYTNLSTISSHRILESHWQLKF